ncbi:MAG: hypothetical protein K0R83_2967 [Caulobacter sp.]|jgi:hypothetical protein|nr:hypothetical protein [Caulobacter sp.]
MRTPLLVLGIGCIVGCAAWMSFGRWDRGGPSGVDAAPTRPTAPHQVSIVDALSMPLFSAPSSMAQPVAQPTPTTNLRLIGISFTPRRRAAFLSSGGQGFWLAVGQSKDGVTVTKLERTAVEVHNAGAVQRLELFKTLSPPASAAVAEPGPPKSLAREPASAPALTPTPPAPKSDPAPQQKGMRE